MTKKKVNHHKVLQYTAVIEEETEGGFSVWIPDLPGCASQGETIEEALANIKEAAELYLEDGVSEDQLPTSKRQFVLPVNVNYA